MARVNNTPIIIDHNSQCYKRNWWSAGINRYNGAFFYSKEIVTNIIPKIKTDRNWVTVNSYGVGVKDHSIVFIHNNLHPENYKWLKKFKDMILVCGVPETCDKVKHLGTPIYLPLSVDVEYIKSFKKSNKTKARAFAGRRGKVGLGKLPVGIDYLASISRNDLLRKMADYETIYAVGRTAIEAKILGCEVRPYDRRFPDPSVWKVLDNSKAATILQKELDKIDGKNKRSK